MYACVVVWLCVWAPIQSPMKFVAPTGCFVGCSPVACCCCCCYSIALMRWLARHTHTHTHMQYWCCHSCHACLLAAYSPKWTTAFLCSQHVHTSCACGSHQVYMCACVRVCVLDVSCDTLTHLQMRQETSLRNMCSSNFYACLNRSERCGKNID